MYLIIPASIYSPGNVFEFEKAFDIGLQVRLISLNKDQIRGYNGNNNEG